MLTDLNGRHRREDHKFYKMVEYPLTLQDFKPFDIVLSSDLSFISAGIRFFQQVNGQSAWLSHCGQVISLNGELVVSEALFPRHKYTPVTEYLKLNAAGKSRVTLVRLNNVWKNDEQRIKAEEYCLQWHLQQRGVKYTTGIFMPMALVGIFRIITPLMRGKEYKSIPIPNPQAVFVCSTIIDYGWFVGQTMVGKDFFPSTLHAMYPSPMDIWNGPYNSFVGGWKKEEVHNPQKRLYSNLK